MEYMKFSLPFLFFIGTFVFNWLREKTIKPVYGNPVVFNDGGNPWLSIASLVCLVGFAISLFIIGIMG